MTDFFEQIGDYLEGRLSDTEIKAFRSELSKNDALRQAVEDHDVVDSVLDLLVEEDIRGVISEIDNEKGDEEYGSNKGMPRGIKSYLIFGILMILLALISYVINTNLKPKEEILYAAYFKPYIAEGTRGDNVNIDELSECDKGHYYMTKGEYDQASKSLELSILNQEVCDKAKWYQALGLLRDGNTDETKKLLEEIIQTENSLYKSSAEKLLEELN